MQKNTRCPPNFRRNKKSGICESYTKKKKQPTLQSVHSIKQSPIKRNSFTKKIHKVNQHKTKKQKEFELKHIIQGLIDKNKNISAPKVNSFTKRIHKVNQHKTRKQHEYEVKHLIQQLNNKTDVSDESITEWIDNLFVINAEIQQQTTQNLQEQITKLDEKQENNLNNLAKQIGHYIEITNDETHKKITDEFNKTTASQLNQYKIITQLDEKQDKNLINMTKQTHEIITRLANNDTQTTQKITQLVDDINKSEKHNTKVFYSLFNENIGTIENKIKHLEKKLSNEDEDTSKEIDKINKAIQKIEHNFKNINELHTTLHKRIDILQNQVNVPKINTNNEFNSINKSLNSEIIKGQKLLEEATRKTKQLENQIIDKELIANINLLKKQLSSKVLV